MGKFSDNCCPIPRVPTYSYYTADVFSDRIFGGNPLAVFPEASGLTRTQMQKIAAEFNFSETVFVFPPETPQGTKKVRIFTPSTELPFAGHPTVGTAYILALGIKGGSAPPLSREVGGIKDKIYLLFN